VVIETDQMYYNRKVAEHAAASLRRPVTVRHYSTSMSPAAAQAWEAACLQQQPQQQLHQQQRPPQQQQHLPSS
jgi:hypothetical protein